MTDRAEAVWKALGLLVGRYLRLKKGVSVQKFGTFTLTSAPVDLEGVTNPAVRERDSREPVFIVYSDFAPGIRPGISHSTGIRPYTAKGFSGKVPIISLNYTELSRIAGVEKDFCKRALDEAIRELSDTAAAGTDVRRAVGPLGSFVVKSGVAAVVFDTAWLKSSPGQLTADGAQWMKDNLSVDLKPEEASQPRGENTLSESRRQNAPSMKSLLTSPVDFLLENQARVVLLCQMKDQSNSGLLPMEELLQCVRALDNATLTDDLVLQLVEMTNSKQGNSRVRYRDLLRGLQRFKTPSSQPAQSDVTENYDRAAVVPLARRIWDSKMQLTDLAQKGGMRPRLKTTASELLSILKKANMNVNIHQLKAFLREDQLDATAVSVLDIISAARSVLKPETADLSIFSDILSQKSTASAAFRESDRLRDFFQSHPLTEVFFKARNDADIVTLSAFLRVVQELSGGRVKGFEAQREFMQASKGKTELTATEFWAAFRPQESRKQVEERSLRVVREWLRQERLTALQGFQRLLSKAATEDRLNKLQFLAALSDFALTAGDAEVLFACLDGKGEGFVDLSKWLQRMAEADGAFQAVRELFARANIPKSDVTARLNLAGKDLLTESDLMSTLQQLDSSLSPQERKVLARIALRGKDVLTVSDFTEQLAQQYDQSTTDWLDSLYRDIRRKLAGQPQRLRSLFEGADIKRVGRLTVAGFKDCLASAGLALEQGDVARLVALMDPADAGIVNYTAFLDKLIGPEYVPQDPLKATAERLAAYLRQNSITAEQLIARMGGSVPILTFGNFLSSKVHQKLSPPEMAEIASKMDVNGDGNIDSEDLQATLNSRNKVAIDGHVPGASLSTEQARAVLADIRSALQRKKMPYHEAFRRLDAEGNGIVTFASFMSGLDGILPLSADTKSSLFRLFDSQNIGMVDYPAFLRILRDSDIDPKQQRDNWEWEHDVIAKIKAWASTEKLTTEAAFRAFDRDFDGVLSKSDLRDSLITLLKIEDLPPAKVDRLHKLLDVFKRNSVQLADFKVIFEENRRPDWKSSAKQQIGLYLSRHFPSLTESFEKVSEFSGKVTFAQFQQLVESKDLLAGFSLTTPLLQELFADIDTKRKGFLSDSDWSTAFGAYQHKQVAFAELKDTLRSNFGNLESAFDFFLSFHLTQPPGKVLTSEFEAAVESLIPKRFAKPEMKVLWQRIAGERSVIDFKDFAAAFSDVRFMSDFGSRKSSRQSSERNTLRSSSTSRLSTLSEDDPFRRLQALLKTSPKSLEQLFQEVDTAGTGKVSATEFRNALRSLNLGLTARDIDQLLYRIDTNNDGRIDYSEFSRRFQPTDAERRIKSVVQHRVSKLRNYMFDYMISPRDAFRQFDATRSGRMEFSTFTSLVRKLYECSGEPVPAFSVLKDLFDEVDSRRDGYLDIKEWLSVFKQEQTYQGWSASRQFDDVAKTIGKNRKMLLLTFEAIAVSGRVTPQAAKDVLSTVLKSTDLTEDQWREVLRVGEKEGAVDFRQLLDVYRDRALAGGLHPKS